MTESKGHTLALNTGTWDLQLDETGRIKTTTGDYAVAQNVANAVRLFTEDAFYYPERGIPHFVADLGVKLNPAVARSEMHAAAMSVDGVQSAQVAVQVATNGASLWDGNTARPRTLTGDIRLTMTSGDTYDVTL